jgi:hypothetical protein
MVEISRADDLFAARGSGRRASRRRIVVNLEHYRKDAKRLLRAFKAGAPEALARAEEALGGRARARFLLTDAQYVIAVELGYRSWPDLRRAIERAEPQRSVAPSGQARSETVIDTGLEYRPGDPVRVRVVRREHRISVTDDGAAIEKAGRPPRWRKAADRLDEELDVNIGQGGVISLPVVRVGPCEQKIVRRIGEASLGLYQELLELGG